MKLVVREHGTEALLAELSTWEGYVSSELLGVEAIRACGRYGRTYAEDARAWLHDVALLPLGPAVVDEAASLLPSALRSLDALHLATALTIRDDVGVFVAYDEVLLNAARQHGLPVAKPGA